MLRALMIIALASTLTACAGFRGLDNQDQGPQLETKPIAALREYAAKPPRALIKDCPDPKFLPTRALSAGQVERSWGADRAHLVECKRRHQALRRFYQNRDEYLSGQTTIGEGEGE